MPFRGHGQLAETWWAGAVPVIQSVLSSETYVGNTFQVTHAGRLFGASIYMEVGSALPRWLLVWNFTTSKIVSAYKFRDDVTPKTGWMNSWIRPTVRLNTSDTFRVAVLKNTSYRRTLNALTSPVTHGNIKFINGFSTSTLNPILASFATAPNANGVDVLYQSD